MAFPAEDDLNSTSSSNSTLPPARRRMKHGLLKTQIGTPYYMSPEIWANKPYNESSDMWALGCLIYELCALHPPFLGDSFPQLKRAVMAGRYKSIPRCYR